MVVVFESFGRSFEITKICLDVLMKDKELILFPILAGITSFFFLLIMIFPLIVSDIFYQILGPVGAVVQLITIFVFYLGSAFVATFFNTCVVYTIKKRFEGGNATVIESISFALSKVHLIFMWSLLSATVGIIMMVISNMTQKAGPLGKMLGSIINTIIGGVWAIVTIFVVPAMVYDGVGPMGAIKSSVETLKKTWGESLIRHFGLGFAQGVVIFVGGLVWVILFIILLFTFPLFALVSIIFLIMYILAVSLFFSVLNTIFNTALFVYARTGQIPSGYSEDIMKNAFKKNENA